MQKNHKPWISSEIKNLIKEREKSYRKYIKANNEAIKTNHFNKYKSLRNKTVNLCRQKKKEYYEKFFSENLNNVRNIWKGIKQIIKISEKKTSNQLPYLLEMQFAMTLPKLQQNLIFTLLQLLKIFKVKF